ncbi:LOW QUALITY PROTEIN: polyprotein [Phytophthora megakarya]|uniref:Polyprotein n=1 Tax=Phytophthora megakarya TaxID=4795 RepID=A0A225WJ47_9STRA|nr:LOW QUALITY PROTEIN: polyprotein [Phytophthora megakarya]
MALDKWLIVNWHECGDHKQVVTKDEHGLVKRFIHGFKQKFGVNYNEAFEPYNVKTAFLHGKLGDTVFMELLQGQGSSGNRQICRLIKSFDHGLYTLHEKGEIVMLLTVYVDDLLVMGEQTRCAPIVQKLEGSFELVDPLGVEVSIGRDTFFSQASYIEEFLRRFHMHDCRGSATPEATSFEDLGNTDDAELQPTSLPYREIVGAFQYLVSGSRPDIAHVVRKLGQHMATFMYLQATKHFGLRMLVTGSAKHTVMLTIQTTKSIISQSVSGYVTKINGSVGSYGSRKQGLNA